MKRMKIYGALAALVLTSSTAIAFQEDTRGAGASAKSQPDAAGLASGGVAKRPDSGTVVSIPGLGKLGVLPKMDFGLELLYGAAEVPGSADNRLSEPDPQGDLKVRGEIKHRF